MESVFLYASILMYFINRELETHAIDSRGNYTRGILKKNQRSNPVTLRVLGTFQDVSGALGHSVSCPYQSHC